MSTIIGTSASDLLIGTSGADVINGNSGADSLEGSSGDDVYVVDNARDVVVEAPREGNDTIQSTISIDLSLAAFANVENVTLLGTKSLNATGGAATNLLLGNSAANKLDGGVGADTMQGGAGNDTYVVDNAGDVITEIAAGGTDSVLSSVSYTLSDANLENITLTGSAAINATGNALNNVLTGNAGNNVLDGGAGADKMIGGLGDDTYIVNSAGDVVTEAANAGTDTVKSWIGYTLGANLENLTLLGSADINATGNTLANILTGNAGANKLSGGAGADTMAGGQGDDVYIIDNAGDIVTELANQGTDEVRSSLAIGLIANVENYTFTGSTAVSFTGDDVANRITGTAKNDTLAGAGGNDTLAGGGGADNLAGGTGNDTYVVDNAGDVVVEAPGEGTDTIQSTISIDLSLAALANVENVTLLGTTALNATGNALNNVLTGNAGNNILDGGAGADKMIGGLGDDTYIVDNAGDVVTEAASAGTDTVKSWINYTLGDNLENLTLLGSANITATGNALNNVLTGNAGNNVLDGGAGADKMIGGLGDDTYIVNNAGDAVTEAANAGTDTVKSWIGYTLGANLENLTLLGSADINATGNTLANILTGNAGANKLSGGDGNDLITGGAGNDTIDGGKGTDTAVFAGLVSDYQVAAGANGTVIVSALNGTDGTDTLANVELFDFSDGTYQLQNGQLARAGVTAPTLTVGPATGQEDTSVALNISASIPASSSTTLSFASTSTSTETLSVVISGVPAGAALSAGTHNADGTWTLTGPQLSGLSLIPTSNYSGALSLTVDAKAYSGGELVAETTKSLNVAVDAIADAPLLSGSSSYACQADGLTSYVMPLDITASLTDLDGSESLTVTVAGLPAGATLSAGTHNADGSWTLTPAMLAGLQLTLPSSVTNSFNFNVTATSHEVSNGSTASVSQTDNVTVTLAVNQTVPGQNIVGTAGADSLVGTSGADTIDGKAGVDTMAGGAGNDTYYADGSGDKITELAGQGTDTVYTADTHNLEDNVENLIITGTWSGSKYYGNGLDNSISGNATSNWISAGAGNDTITGGGGDDTIDGGDGTDVVVYAGKFADYQITTDPWGQTIVTALSGSDGTDTLAHVETIQFADQAYQTGSTSSSGGGSSGGGTSTSGIVYAPAVIQSHNPGDVVGIRVENNTDHADAPQILTFGQTFVQGDVPAGAHLIALVNGQQIPVQVDVKTINADGSIRFAIITLQAPTMAAHSALDVMLAKGTPATSGPAIAANDMLTHGYNEQLTLTFHHADGSTTAQTVDIGNALSQAIAAGTVQYWIDGPLATEVRVTAPINAQMNATFDIRQNADGTFTTGVTVSNNSAYQVAQTFTYDAKITDHGNVVLSQNNISQYSYSNWHQDISSGGAAADANIVHDIAYVEKTGAIPSYDTSLGVASSEIASEANALANSNTGILGNALITQYMPGTGGRPDIGPTTQWAAEYLVSQDLTSAKVMYAEANAAGSVPWHFLDQATGRPVTITDHPNLWIDSRGTVQNYGSDSLPTPYSPGGGWTPDPAHQSDLTYVPYLLTGDHYYLDELQYQASYDLAAFDPGYRGSSEGLFYGQQRALAWSLREVADAAFATPDSDPLKGYFTAELNNNLNQLVQTYITNNAEAAWGQIQGFIDATPLIAGYNPGANDPVAPWQQDYLVMTLGTIANQGFAQADQLLNWMCNFVAGRFINGDNGYDPLHGPAYWLAVTDSTGHPYSTWQDLYNANFGGTSALTTLDGYPDLAGGYAAEARGSLATLITHTGSVDAIEAYGFVVGHTPNMLASFQTDPAFNITPVLPDGHHLLNSEMQVAPTTGDVTLTATTSDSLLVGGSGHDTLQGGNGMDLLFGGTGSTSLIGGSGNDYLFAGSAGDRLSAGAGTNYLKAGAGHDTVVLSFADVVAHDTVVDFQPGADVLEIHTNGVAVTAASIIAGATSDSSGNAVLHLGSQHDITFVGIQISQISPDTIHMM